MTNKENKGNALGINWFPGHMTKTLRMMKAEMDKVDVVIYVIDSRIVASSLNPEFVSFIKNKPVLYVLNKFDLCDEKKTLEISKNLKRENAIVIKLDASKSGAGKIVEPLILKLAQNKIEKFRKKGIKILPRAMVIGVPNCGKSTLINNLCKGAKTETGNRPGVTRGKQVVTLKSGIQLYDTPGTLWPKFESDETGLNLALVGSIKNEIVDTNYLAKYLVNYLSKNYNNELEYRYKIKLEEKDAIEILQDIGKIRGFLIKGGEIDYDRTCAMLITEFRKGLIGKITLD